AVKWIEGANIASDNGTVRKNGGCDGCADAGAASDQRIQGTGYLEFTGTVENALRYVGLSDSNDDNTAADIDFGLRLQGSTAEVREGGTYRSELTFSAGDVFRISVDKGR